MRLVLILWTASVVALAGRCERARGGGSCPSEQGHALVQTRRGVRKATPMLDPRSCVEAAVIEPRKLASIAVALESAAAANVSDRPPRRIDVLTVVHGWMNADYVRGLVNASSVLSAEERGGRLRFVDIGTGDLGGDLLQVSEHAVMSYHDQYSRVIKSTQFWGNFECDNILLMQSDSVLCRNSRVRLAEFLDSEYEYIGGHTPGQGGPGQVHINGGFSFRRRAGMLRCLQAYVPPVGTEDDFFSKCEDLVRAPVDVLDRFAIDNALKPIQSTAVPLGVHKPFGVGQFRESNMALCEGAKDLWLAQ